MNKTNILVDAFVLSYKREKNLSKVIRGLKKQSFINKIYVFHNFPSKRKEKDVINIYSEKNHGCIVRHVIALISECEYVLFVDDDLELKGDFSQRLRNAIKLEPNAIIGLFGVNVDKDAKLNDLYSTRGHYKNSSFARYVDLIKGRVHLTKKQNIIDALNFTISHPNLVKKIGKNILNADDIILNMSSQLRTKKPSILIPCKADEVCELPAEHGVCLHKDHFYNRSKIVKYFLKNGWIPRANSYKYFNLNATKGKKRYLLEEIKRSIELKNLNQLKKCIKNTNQKNIPILYLYNYAGLLYENFNIKSAMKFYSLITRTSKKKELKIKGLSLFKMGLISFHSNRKEEAKQLFIKALEIIPDHKLAKTYLRKIDAKSKQ